MNNLIVLPMIIPLITAIILAFLKPYIKTQRWISALAMLITGGLSVYILHLIQTEGILVLEFGGWAAPYGIVFVADSFAMLLVITACFVTFVCLLYAFSTIDKDMEKMFFYTFVLLLVAGVNGSFLTGDLFNLFVCYEVMLIASYVLIMLGGNKFRLQESLKYLAINVISSWIFLIGIAYLYGAMGTVNLADLSLKVAEVGQTPLVTTVSILFLIVFALKSGLLLFFWLPGSYSVPPTAIAALFGALLTKVGVYSMIRMFTLIFYHEPGITHRMIGFMAALTIIVGCLGAIAYKDVRQIVSYNVVIAIGFMMVALPVSTTSGYEGAIYYLIHDMIVKALLFLLIGTMIMLTGKTKITQVSGLIRNYPILGWFVFIVILSLAGIPPFSGFMGKVLIGQGAVESKQYLLLALAFISSLLVLYSLLRIFLNCFWGETIMNIEDEMPLRKRIMVPTAILIAATIGLGLGAEFISTYVSDAAETLMNPTIYIDAVLSGK